nr:antirestriction protein ArdA [Carnobacterium maltaromaticum]
MDSQKDKERKMELVKVTEEMMIEQDGKRVYGYPDEVVRVIAENRGAEVTIIELDGTGMSDREKLGYVLVDLGYYDIPQRLANYIDYEAIGRDYDFGTSGEFTRKYFIEFKND